MEIIDFDWRDVGMFMVSSRIEDEGIERAGSLMFRKLYVTCFMCCQSLIYTVFSSYVNDPSNKVGHV